MHIGFLGDLVFPSKYSRSLDLLSVVHQDVKSVLLGNDYNIYNQETTIKNTANAIDKIGPVLTANREYFSQLYSGLNLTHSAMANNHIADFGVDGAQATTKELNLAGIKTFGLGTPSSPSYVVFSEENKSVAVVNLCEEELGLSEIDSIHYTDKFSTGLLISKLKCSYDYLIVYVHGGVENYELPTPRMQRLFRSYVDAGVDLVVGCHSHCIQAYEEYLGSKIYYGLGNFYYPESGIKYQGGDQGLMLTVTLESGTINVSERTLGYSEMGLCFSENKKRMDLSGIPVEERFSSFVDSVESSYLARLFGSKLVAIGIRRIKFLRNHYKKRLLFFDTLTRDNVHSEIVSRFINK